MKKAIYLILSLVLLTSSCELFNNGKNKKLDPETLSQMLPGTWRWSQAGADEVWHFSEDRTYVKVKRFDLEFGTWGINEAGLIMAEQKEASGTPYDVLLDGNLLMLDDLSLIRDSLAGSEVEEALSEKLVGKWQSKVAEEIYEFMPNGYMIVRYADEMSEDGRWSFSGNQLVENNAARSAAPVFFDGNEMQWSTQRFTRIGDIAPEDIPAITPSTNISVKGQPIEQHKFDANLGNFGQVAFTPHWEDRFGESIVHYYLLRNGVAVYEFPEFSEAKGKFDGLKAVSARDLNSDGKLDIIVMADYVQEGIEGGTKNTINGIYINKGSSFSFDRNLSQKMNQDKGINSVNDIVKAVRGSSTSSGKASKPSTATSLAKYKGDKTICRIRVASLQGTIDYEAIGKLSDLGILSFEPSDNGYTRVYLGNYVGKYTAYKVIQQVKRRGYPSAFVVEDQDFLNKQEEGGSPYSTYQIYSSKKLNVGTLNEIGEKYREQVFIIFTGTNYRVSLGMYQKDLYPYEEQTYAGLGGTLGYEDGFSKKVN